MNTRIGDFQSEHMKRNGIPPEWMLWQKICSHPGGPAKAIDGKTYYFPPSTLWEHVPGSPIFQSEQAAIDFYGL